MNRSEETTTEAIPHADAARPRSAASTTIEENYRHYTKSTILQRSAYASLGLFVAISPYVIPCFSSSIAAQTHQNSQINHSGKYTPTNKPSSIHSSRQLALISTGNKKFQIGQVKLDLNERTITLPATVEKPDAALEYALVGQQGKIHESLLSTTALPAQLHYAALLLKPEPNSAITITVTYPKHGPDAHIPLEKLIQVTLPAQGKKHLKHWIYNGSKTTQRGLSASSEKSFIALINDPSALINRAGSATINRDDIYSHQRKSHPRKGTPITLTIKFPKLSESNP